MPKCAKIIRSDRSSSSNKCLDIDMVRRFHNLKRHGKSTRNFGVDTLPDEIMLMIFEELSPQELLGPVSQVCKRWAALAAQQALLAERPEQLLEFKWHLRVRGVRVLTRLTSNLLNDFLLEAQYLRDITICCATPLASDHFQVLSSLQHLDHLDVFLQNRVMDESTVPTVSRLRSLVVNETVGPHVISALATSKRLNALHMHGRSLYFPLCDLIKLLDLRFLYLQEMTLRCTELHDDAYAAIGQCKLLVILQLYSCWLMTGVGATYLTRLPRLRCLHVTGARMVRSSALSAILPHLPMYLEELVLSVSAFGDEHVALLVEQRMLYTLELWRCHISGKGVLLLAKCVPSLRVLDLDIMLTNEQIEELNRHPNLFHLRCLTEPSTKLLPFENSKCKEDQEVDTDHDHLRIQDTNEQYPNKYFRSSGEGYRGSLFYYWTQKMELSKTPMSKCIPGFDENCDFY